MTQQSTGSATGSATGFASATDGSTAAHVCECGRAAKPHVEGVP